MFASFVISCVGSTNIWGKKLGKILNNLVVKAFTKLTWRMQAFESYLLCVKTIDA